MEARVDRLEAKIDKVDDRLRGVETGLATLTERVAHLPSKSFMVKASLGIVGGLGALVTFQEQIQTLLHVAAP